MSAAQNVKPHRRSLLAALAAVFGALSLPAESHAAASDEATNVPRGSNARAHGTLDLKTVGPAHQVASIRQADGSYRVTNKAGETLSFSEFDLRFKTDSGPNGPSANAPVLLAAGSQGDRATVVFFGTDEIGRFIAGGAATESPANPNRAINGEAE